MIDERCREIVVKLHMRAINGTVYVVNVIINVQSPGQYGGRLSTWNLRTVSAACQLIHAASPSAHWHAIWPL